MSLAAYIHELRSQANRILADHPEIAHQWRDDELVFPATGPEGFAVTLQPGAQGIIVLTDVGLHEHVEGVPADAVQDALGLVRDLLSPDMRVRERCAGGRGYRWVLERREPDGWSRGSETGLLFWNYFGRRSERIHQNRQLPGRLAGDPPPEASDVLRKRGAGQQADEADEGRLERRASMERPALRNCCFSEAL